MKLLFHPTAAVLSLFIGLGIADSAIHYKPDTPPSPRVIEHQKIQAAILLDVSGSMTGLIEQAKAQLWNMVSTMGKVKCEAGVPQIEIALYEYGRTTNNEKAGYIKQISPFTSDLDQLSKELFALNTDGGDEYCGHVIRTSLEELGWDQSSNHYKVIFIAGNEDFLQGSVSWKEACKKAKSMGVIVNTIYCGNKSQGIRENWNLSGECGSGSYSNIDHNASEPDIFTPYDSVLFLYNDKLNQTYLAYGTAGATNSAKQASVDRLNVGFKSEAMAKRVAVKGNKALYNNSGWDLVDATEKDGTIITRLDKNHLPDSLKNLNKEQLKRIINEKAKEREAIQREIKNTSKKRDEYIAAERKKAAATNAPTLETAIETTIREQVKRFNMKVE